MSKDLMSEVFSPVNRDPTFNDIMNGTAAPNPQLLPARGCVLTASSDARRTRRAWRSRGRRGARCLGVRYGGGRCRAAGGLRHRVRSTRAHRAAARGDRTAQALCRRRPR